MRHNAALLAETVSLHPMRKGEERSKHALSRFNSPVVNTNIALPVIDTVSTSPDMAQSRRTAKQNDGTALPTGRVSRC